MRFVQTISTDLFLLVAQGPRFSLLYDGNDELGTFVVSPSIKNVDERSHNTSTQSATNTLVVPLTV